MSQLRLQLMGTVCATSQDGEPVAFYSDRVRALLCVLMLDIRASISRHELAALLWPRYRQGSALVSLRKALYELKKVLPAPDLLIISRGAIGLRRTDPRIWCDVLELERLFHQTDSSDPRARSEQIRSLNRGVVCQGLHLDNSEGFEVWLERQRARIRAHLDAAEGQHAPAPASDDDTQRPLSRILAALALADKRLITVVASREQWPTLERQLLQAEGQLARPFLRWPPAQVNIAARRTQAAALRALLPSSAEAHAQAHPPYGFGADLQDDDPFRQWRNKGGLLLIGDRAGWESGEERPQALTAMLAELLRGVPSIRVLVLATAPMGMLAEHVVGLRATRLAVEA